MADALAAARTPFFVLKGIALSSSAERKCNLPMAVISYPASRTR